MIEERQQRSVCRESGIFYDLSGLVEQDACLSQRTVLLSTRLHWKFSRQVYLQSHIRQIWNARHILRFLVSFLFLFVCLCFIHRSHHHKNVLHIHWCIDSHEISTSPMAAPSQLRQLTHPRGWDG